MAEKFTLDAEIKTVGPFGNGRINDTFLVETVSGEHFVLQRVNPIFAPSVLEDIAIITQAMKDRGFTTTELIITTTGELGVIEGGECWRMLSFVPGRTIEEGISKEEAQSAMELIGVFHETFAEHTYTFRHVREGFHDTSRIMSLLEDTTCEYTGTKKHEALGELSTNITYAYKETPHAWAHLPKRIIHGDPKLSNIRFAAHSKKAITLLDLDTLGRHSVVVDIADAARSWCNRADEGDATQAQFDLDIFCAMMDGYTKKANFLTKEEREAIPGAIAQIALELAARFTTDAYRESYFTLDHAKYPDLFTQNSAKARAQFALYQDILRKLPDISVITQ